MRAQEAPASQSVSRLLIPITRTRQSGATAYAVRRAATGGRIEACLLHVEEALGPWQLLKYFRSGELTTRRLIEPVLESASAELLQANVPHAAYLRSGAVVFAILDAAEELNCTEIVVPAPGRGWWQLFANDTVAALCARQRGIPVVVVAPDGGPAWPAKRRPPHRPGNNDGGVAT